MSVEKYLAVHKEGSIQGWDSPTHSPLFSFHRYSLFFERRKRTHNLLVTPYLLFRVTVNLSDFRKLKNELQKAEVGFDYSKQVA